VNKLAFYLNEEIDCGFDVFNLGTFHLELNEMTIKDITEHFIDDLVDVEFFQPTKRLNKLIDEIKNRYKDDPEISNINFIHKIDFSKY
jgi:hypothetical protein